MRLNLILVFKSLKNQITRKRRVPHEAKTRACLLAALLTPIDPLRFLCCYSGEEEMNDDGDRTDVQFAVAVAVELSLVTLSSTK